MGESCYACPGPLPKDGYTSYLGQEEWVKCETDGVRFPVSQLGYFTDIKVLPVVIRDCIPREACPTHDTEAVMLEAPCKPGYKVRGGVHALSARTGYSDAKVANRNVGVWHVATENGP